MTIRKWIPALALLAIVGCAEQEGQRVELGNDAEQQSDVRRADWPEGLAERVDAGNTAYAEERFEESAEIFRELTEEHPNIGTVWFGLYMSENALGNDAEAREALEMAESINPGLGIMHEAAESGMMGEALQGGSPHPDMTMPEGHPPTEGGMDDASSEGGR